MECKIFQSAENHRIFPSFFLTQQSKPLEFELTSSRLFSLRLGLVDLPLTHEPFALTTSNLVGCQVYFSRSPKLAELMKPSLYGNHGNHSTTKCIFAVSRKNVVKNHPISNSS